MKYGILIGRFQPIHIIHQSIISEIIHDGLHPIVFVGSANKSDNKNPYSYVQRAAMIHKLFGELVTTLPSLDHKDNNKWGASIYEAIRDLNINPNECLLYYYYKENDSDISQYLNFTNIKRPCFPDIHKKLICASDIRKEPNNFREYIDGRVVKMIREFKNEI